MTLENFRLSGLGLLAAMLLAVAPSIAPIARAGTNDDASIQEVPEPGVQQELDKQLAKRRHAMLEEAHSALDETNAALQALDTGDSKTALDALERATGKLELLVARDPALALAPVDIDFVTHDLYATPDDIRIARSQAEDLLDDGQVQQARSILSGLASEIDIRVTNIPLATYPDAIKEVTPLIDDGKTEEAKEALNIALGTLVVTHNVISLPVLRARAALDEAQDLVKTNGSSKGDQAKAESPSKQDQAKIQGLVDTAREQLEIAELLGYGNEKDYETYRKQIAELEGKIGENQETDSVFAKLRRSLDEFETSFFQ